MKLRTKLSQVAGQYTRDGVTIPVTRTHQTTIPALPRDWHTITLRGVVGIVVCLTALSVAWSTWSIGSLLGGGIGYTVAVVFDIGWAVTLMLEYLSRYDARKRKFPELLGWVLLATTMGAIGWHGYHVGSLAMAVVGAFVSFFAKVLWLGVMKHVNAELSDDDAAWVAHQLSEAQSKAAVASMKRQSARIEQRAALELLAMERERMDMAEAFGLNVEIDQPAVERVELPALTQPTVADMSKADAVRFVLGQLPEASHHEIADVLASHGVSLKPDYIRQILNRSKPQTEVDEVAEVITLHK